MALHRKQRAVVDPAPQYVRIPTSYASRAMGYSLHETHPHAQRVFAKRYAAGDRSRKISSLQLRACFALCVLLYFGAIYFADDIANIGRVVGSEQSSQNFFVHSLRPRGRGNMRLGRAVDAKKMDAPPSATVEVGVPEQNLHEKDDQPTRVPDDEIQTEVATTETEEARATEPREQPETAREVGVVHQYAQKTIDDVPGDAVHPDDQGEDIPAGQSENRKSAHPVQDKYIDQVKIVSADLIEPTEEHLKTREHEQEGPIYSAAPKKYAATARDKPHPTAAVRHEDDPSIVAPAASPLRVKEQQHLRSTVDPASHTNWPVQEARPIRKQQGGEDHQKPTAAPAREGVTQHVTDI